MMHDVALAKLPLSTSEGLHFLNLQNADGKVLKYFRCLVPAGIEIRRGLLGHGLFATRQFKKGERISQNRYHIVEDNDDQYCLVTQFGNFWLENKDYTHFIKTKDKKKLSTFDSFMNHSCEASVVFTEDDDLKYTMIASQNIALGEELTCNYSSFCYEFFEDVIDQCCCGHASCQGSIRGFKHLPLHTQIEMLPFAESAVKEAFFNEKPYFRADHLLWSCSEKTLAEAQKLTGHIIIAESDHAAIDAYLATKRLSSDDRRLVVLLEVDDKGHLLRKFIKGETPSGLAIKRNDYGYGLFAERSFKKGSTLYINRFALITDDHKHNAFHFVSGKNTFKLDKTHSVKVNKTMRHLFTFDSFMNHSCEPNYRDEVDPNDAQRYIARAIKDIAPGEEITCDYNLFDFDCDGHHIEACLCGAATCKQKPVGYKYLNKKQKEQIAHLLIEDIIRLESAKDD